MNKKLITTNKGVPIGREAKTLLNILVGANTRLSLKDEICKVDYLLSVSEKVDIITDLSLYRNTNPLWEYVLRNTHYMAGTVPVYLSINSDGVIDENLLLELICEQCEKGVSIITIHPTVNYKLLDLCKERIIPCTSRGGGIVARDMIHARREINVYLNITCPTSETI